MIKRILEGTKKKGQPPKAIGAKAVDPFSSFLKKERRWTMSQRDFIKEFVMSKFNGNLDETKAIALSVLVEEAINRLMEAEREIYLENNQDKGSGFYKRYLASGINKMEVNVPRTRNGDFRPSILPPLYQRTENSYSSLLNALIVNGYSDAGFENFFREMNLPYSKTELSRLKEELKQKVEDFKTREIPESVFAVFIDGFFSDVKLNGIVKKCCLYSVVGMSFSGEKSLLGFYLIEGTETIHKWREIFEDLIKRGLKKIMILISDDL